MTTIINHQNYSFTIVFDDLEKTMLNIDFFQWLNNESHNTKKELDQVLIHYQAKPINHRKWGVFDVRASTYFNSTIINFGNNISGSDITFLRSEENHDKLQPHSVIRITSAKAQLIKPDHCLVMSTKDLH